VVKQAAPPPPVNLTHIRLYREAEKYEITFPNITGYRMESLEGELKYDFSNIENYEIDLSATPIITNLATAFSPEEVE